MKILLMGCFILGLANADILLLNNVANVSDYDEYLPNGSNHFSTTVYLGEIENCRDFGFQKTASLQTPRLIVRKATDIGRVCEYIDDADFPNDTDADNLVRLDDIYNNLSSRGSGRYGNVMTLVKVDHSE